MASLPASTLLIFLILNYGSDALGSEGPASVGCGGTPAAAGRLDALLALYERQKPPAVPLVASVSVDLRHATVNERESQMRMLADLIVEWQDARLAWNITEWGCDTTHTSAERLWLPDVWLLNGAAESAGSGDGEGDLPAKIKSDGTVTWVRRLEVLAPVALQLADWPSDVQRCDYKFGSRRLSVNELDLRLQARKYATVSESGAWRVQSMLNSATTVQQGEESRTLIIIKVAVQRRAAAQAAATGAVLAAALLLLAAAAFLPPADRPALCACASFVTTLWMISAMSRLPSAASTPVGLWVMGAAACAGAGGAAAAGLARRVARLRARCPSALRSVLAAVGRRCSLAPDQEEGTHGDSGTWAAAAKLLDYVLTTALLLTVLVLACIYIFS